MTNERRWRYWWAQWQSASGEAGPLVGSFVHRLEAERYVEAEMDRFASDLEHGTGEAGSWEWDATHLVATLFRDDLDIALGRYIIEREPEITPLPDDAARISTDDRNMRSRSL
jgi:hypothetical protein